MDNKMQKVLFIAVAITMIVAAFFGGMAYEKTQPIDIAITSGNESVELIHTEIQPLSPDMWIIFPDVDGASEYHVAVAH